MPMQLMDSFREHNLCTTSTPLTFSYAHSTQTMFKKIRYCIE